MQLSVEVYPSSGHDEKSDPQAGNLLGNASSPSDVISTFSNQIRTPLGVVFGMISVLSRLIPLQDNNAKEYLSHLTQNCYKILRTTTNYSELAKYQTGTNTLHLHQHDLTGFIQNLIRSTSALLKSLSIKITCTVPENPIITFFDEDKIANVILNILVNSMLYTRDGNNISVSVSRMKNYARISISDRGRGIPTEYLDRVFEPYFTVPNEDDPRPNSSGIGLTLVKKIITEHRGTVALNSELGIGTTVVFTLPIMNDHNDSDTMMNDSCAEYLSDRFSPIYINLADLYSFPTLL